MVFIVAFAFGALLVKFGFRMDSYEYWVLVALFIAYGVLNSID